MPSDQFCRLEVERLCRYLDPRPKPTKEQKFAIAEMLKERCVSDEHVVDVVNEFREPGAPRILPSPADVDRVIPIKRPAVKVERMTCGVCFGLGKVQAERVVAGIPYAFSKPCPRCMATARAS
jgi:hypothetical protein